MSKHTSTRRESRNGVSMARVARLPSGSLPLRRTWPISLCIGLAIGSIAVSADALAGGPTGGTVVGGTGSITQNGNETVINQISQKLALNWETFNLKANESVLFNQPGRSAVALNRILDQNPSQIFGKINSNGQVFLINTHGIIFGATAQMNVGGLMASTLDLTPKDFLAGNYSLNAVGGGAGIVNHGLIQAASGGSVALVGGSVANDGVILANYGSINLDGAEHAVLDFDGNGLINIQITGELKQRLDAREAAVSNTGTLQAEGGTVVLQASAAKDLFTNLVNNSGVIDASGISTDGGVVRLVGTGGNVVNSGSIDASGEHGGSVQLLSDQNVGVTGGIIDASGTAGGGDIRVGGGWQGGEGLQTAQAVYVAPDATLKADATHRGDGGSVVVWGNRVNNFYGTITARGGASGGDGGRVETSAHDGLNAQGRVDASAPAGRAGSWLLDPHDVTLQASGTGSLGGTSPDKYFEASADDSTISTNVIEGALVGGTNVSIFTGTDGTQNGDITVADAIDAPGRGTLYLKAAGSIFVDSNITGTSGSGPLDLYLWANYGGAATDTAYTSRADCATCTVLVGRNDGTVGINIARGVLDIRTGDASHAGGLVQFGNGTAGSTGTIHAGAFSIHGTGIDMGWGNYQFDLLDTTLDAGTGSVSLLDTSGGSGLSFGGNLEVSGNQITLGSSGSTTTIKANTQNYNGAVTLGTNTTLVANTGAVNLAGSLTGTDKNLAITGDSISLDSDIALGTGSATLTATAGSISQTAGRLLSAGALTLNATTGIGVGSALETKVDTLTFTNSGAGGVALNDADALTVSGSTVSGDVTISAQTGDLTIDGDVSSAGNVTLGAGAGNVVYSSGTVSGDAVHFNAGGTNGSIGASGAVSTNASQLSFEARGTGVVRITEADGAAVSGTAGSGNVTITSTTGDLALNGDLSTTGDVDLTALAGSISHTAGTISGGALTLTAGGTNGAIGASDAVLTNVNSIVFSAKGTGAVNIDEAAGVNVSGTAGSGSVGITSATSDLAVVGSGIVTAGGAVTLEASGSGARINIGGSGLDTTNGVAAGANVELVADNADILGTINAGTAGIATIRQATAGRPISLGPDVPDPAPPQLGVTAAELNLITANTIVIGDANSGNLSVNEAIAPAHANTLSLNTGGSISQVAGATITVGTLTGSAVGATTLGEANHIGNFGSFTASSLSLTNADPLTLVGDVTTSGAQTYNAAILLGGNTTLTTTNGAVNFNSTVDNADPTARNLTVNAGNGAVTFAGAVGGDATNGALGALIVNSAGLTTFANVTAASLVTDAGGGTLLGGNITTSGTQTYNDAVTLGNDIVLATTNSAVKFASTVDNATTTARALTVNAGNGALTFGGIVGGNATNGALGGLTTHSGSWSAGGLNIGSGGLSVTTTGGGITQGSKFVVTGLSVFNSGSDAITLENTGNDFQGAVSATGVGVSIIDANDLAMATLSNGPNGEVKLIAGGVLSLPLGAIATGNADLTLVSNGGPLITGDLSGANVSLTGLGLTLNNVTTAGTLNLASGATISQAPGSIITAGTLTGSSVGSTLLTGASNKIGTLGSFTAANLALTNAQALTVTGPVDGGVSTALTTTVGDLAINGAVTGTATTLTSGGAITEGASGLITADTLTGSSVGNTTLLRANQVAALGAFATGGDFAFNNAQSLTVNAAPSANGGLGNLTLTTTGASSDLVLASNLVGNTVTLGSGRNISQTGGTIQATTLTGSSAGSTTLTGANHIGTLGSFSAAGFNLTNAQALAVTGPVDGGASTTLNTSGGDLAINGVVKGTTTTLTSDSAITEGAAGVIIAGTLTGSSTGGTTLNGSNQVGTLGSFTAASFSLTNAQALAVAGLVSGGASTTLITTAGNLAINGAVGGATTTLTSAGAITEGAGGAITAGTLTGSSAGDTTLNAANHVGNLGAFATGGDFAFNNAQSLTVSNAPSANGGAGDLTLTTTGASSDLVLNSNLIGNTVTLGSGRNISQTGGAITATTLSGSSVGSTALNGANQIGTLGSFTAANLALTNAQALTVTGPVDGGASTMLATTAGDLAINGTVKGTTTTLTSGGAITEGASGLIAAGTLTGSSTGSTTLLQANQVTALGAFTTGGDFAFNNAQSLTVSNAPSANGGAGNLTLTTTGASSDLILASTLTGNTVSLGAGRNISQTAGSIQATTLTGSSVGSTTLNGANQIGTLGSFTAANLALTNAQALAVAGPVDGGASTALTTTAGDLAINGAVKGTTTTLTSAGAITEGAAGVITAGTLTGSSAGATTLNGANQIGTLGSFTAANFALTNAQALTVTGALDGGASTALKTTAGNLAINGAVNGTTTTLTSAGAITQSAAGVITAGTLTGSSAGSTTLLQANHVGNLGAFTTGGDFAFNNAQSLTVSNAPSANGGAGNLTLTTTGASSDLILASTLTGNTVSLGAGRNISQTSGAIHATTLTGNSAGSTTLNGANQIGTLGSFTAANFALTNAQALTVTGALDGGASTALKTTAGNLAINGAVKGTTTTLTSAGAITQSAAGVITAGTLTGSSAGSTTLLQANHVGNLGAFTTGGDFAFNNAQSLTVSNAPSANGGAGNLTLTTTGASSDLILASTLTGNTVSLGAGRNISQTSGAIHATTLTGNSAGSTTLNGANQIGTLGSFTAANFALTNAQALTVTGALDGGASTALKTTAGNLAINGAVKGTTTTLNSAGAISEGAAGVITAGTLTGSSAGATTLNGANQIGTLGSFTAANFALTNAQALTVTGALDGGASTTLKTTAGNLAINGAVKGTTTTLTSAGAISQSASGIITAGTLTGISAGSTTLNAANRVGTLGAFTTGGDFAFNNAQSLTVNNAPSANGGAGNLTLTTTGASSDLILASTLTGNTVRLGAGRNINQTAGAIHAATLTGGSAGSTTLTGANHIGALGSFSAAGFNLSNAQSLAVTGPVDGGASTALTTTAGDLAINGAVKGTTTTLTSAGAITEGAGGSITANLLTGHSVGNTTLDGDNHINILGSFSADFSLTNGQTLTVDGPLDGGPAVALTTTAGDLIINGAISGTTTTLTSAGAIVEGAGGVITADTLTGSSAASTTLLGANEVAQLGAFTSGGDFAFNTIGTLTVTDAPSANAGAGNLTLTTTGASSDLILASTLTGNTVTLGAGRNISQTSGAIHATTLTGSSAGSTTLNGANRIGTLGSFTAANFALTNAQALTVTGALDGGASTALKTTAGNLAINGAVKGTTTTLNSAGAISEGAGGVITAGTLTGSSAGATTLNGANQIGTLGSFTAASFALTNAQALTITGPLDGGASTALKTTAGDLAINGAVKGTTTTLTSAGAIAEGTGGTITADTLTGSSSGATTLNGANRVGTLGSFTAAGFAFSNAQTLAVTGPVNGGASTTLTTTAGDLAIDGAVSGTSMMLNSAGRITEGAGGVITAATLSGHAAGPTVLGSVNSPNKNMVDTLGNFTSLAGFSMTNDKTLTLASVAGSAFTVNAGTSPFYLSVTHGDLFQLGTAPVYDGVGVWGSTGRMGTGSSPIYVVGTGPQTIANVGLPPAYFYAVDSSGNLLPLSGGFAINVPTITGAGSAQNGIHGDSYIDPSVITANYRSYGIVPSGVRLPPDQQSGCDPDQPDQAACQDPDALGMVMPWPNAPR